MPDPETKRRVAEYFARKPAAMVLLAARDLGLPEAEILRCLEGAVELKPDAEALLRDLEPFGTCHVIVSNRGATLEARGAFGNFSRSGPFLNVENGVLDLHLRTEAVTSAFCLDKPSHRDRRPIHTVQLFDAAGDAVLKAVMPRTDGAYSPEQDQAFQSLRERHRLRA